MAASYLPSILVPLVGVWLVRPKRILIRKEPAFVFL